MIALIIGLVSLGRYVFSDDKKEDSIESLPTPSKELLTLTSVRSVRVTVRGPIVADEEFTTTRITISPNSRVYEKYSGYLDKIQKSKTYANNMKAYEEFVYALDKAAFTKPGKSKPGSSAEDVRGICATGKVYDYEVMDGGQSVYRAWTSTCKGSPGTFGASIRQVTDLFIQQLPEKDRPHYRPTTFKLF